MIKNTITVIPVHNEEINLKKVILKFKKISRVLIVDDNSSDMTSDISKKYGNFYLKNKKKLGYDQSLKLGIKKALKIPKTKFIITADGDGQHMPPNINFKKIQNYNIIIFNRDFFNRFSEAIISYLSFIFFKIKDPISGLKLFKIEILKENISIINEKNNLIGMFYLKFNNKKILNIRKKVLKKNKPSSFGDGILVNLLIFFTFIKVFFK